MRKDNFISKKMTEVSEALQEPHRTIGYEIRKHLQIIFRYIKVNMSSSMEYRASFFIQAFGMLLSNASFVFFWWIAFQQIGGPIAGYSFKDVMFIWAVTSTAFGLSVILFNGANDLTRLIVTGELDTFLLQPCNLLVNFVCSRSSIGGYGDLIYGFVLLGMTQPTSPKLWLFFLAVALIGALLITAIAITAHTLTFYFGDASMAGGMAVEFVLNFCIYPENIYQGVIKAFMYSIIPAAFIVHIPLKLARGFSLEWLLLWLGVSLVYCCLACVFFFKGLKRYESGNLIITRL